MFACNEHAHHPLQRESFRQPSSVVLFGGGTGEQRQLACSVFRMQEADDAVVVAPQRIAETHYGWADRVLCAEGASEVDIVLERFASDAPDALVLVDPACGATLWRSPRPCVVQCSNEDPELLPKVQHYALCCRANAETQRRFAERIVGSCAPIGEFQTTILQVAQGARPVVAAYMWDARWRWSYALRLSDEKSVPAG